MYTPANSGGFILDRIIAVREKLAAYWPKEHIQPFFLKAETYLVNGQNSYPILLGKSAGKVAFINEKLLQQNDAYAPVGVSIGVKKVVMANNAESNPGKVITYPYAEDTVFDGAAVGGNTEAECVESVFNADFSLAADGKEVLYNLDTAQLKFIPDFRFTATRTQAATGSLADMTRFFPLIKEFVLFGGNENMINISLRGGATNQIEAADGQADTERNKVSICFIGLIVRGGADKVAHIDLPGIADKGFMPLT